MHDDTLAIPPLDVRPRPAVVEPEFGWQSASRPPEPTSAAKKQRRMPAVRSNSVRAGSLLYLVLVGLVAIATIGVFFGTGFLLLAHPAKETVVDSGARDASPLAYGNAFRASREAPPVPRELAAPNSGSSGALSAAIIPQRATVAEAPPLKQTETPPTPIADPPVQTSSVPATGSSSATVPAPQTPAAKPSPLPEQDAAPPDVTKHHPSRSRRSHEARSASRNSHSQSAHGTPSPTSHQGGRTRSFDRLVTQLTGQSPPDVPSLTPPQAKQPDPFALPRPGQ
jgi:hypothetical protein